MAHLPFDDERREVIRQLSSKLIVLIGVSLCACSGERLAERVIAPPITFQDSVAVPAQKPNLIFLLADDLRADAMGVAGNQTVETPNLDALAHAGVMFKNAYVTTPICAISRASIFTGQWARRHGVMDFHTDFAPEMLAATYPALLRSAGYRSGFIGKFGVGDNPPAQAFDFWRGFPGGGFYETTDSAGQPIHLTHLMSQQAVSFLESQPHDKPFVLSLSFKAPHVQDEDPRQFIPETVDASLYSAITIPAPATGADSYWNAFPEFFRTNNEARARWSVLYSTPDKYQASVKGYYRLVTGMDRAIGEIEAELHKKNLDRNTVIVFTSDNGFFLGELGMAHKWYGQEPSVRVPLIVYDPRNPAGQGGRVESSIALNVDIAPTLLDFAGVAIPPQMQGQSLVPLVHGRAVPGWRTDFYFEHLYVDPGIRRSVGVVGGRYKYLKYVEPNPNYEVLYDLAVDPNETTNFADDPRYAGILAQLRQRYAELADKAR